MKTKLNELSEEDLAYCTNLVGDRYEADKDYLIKKYEGKEECTDDEFYEWQKKKNANAKFFEAWIDLDKTEDWYVSVLKKQAKEEMIREEKNEN